VRDLSLHLLDILENSIRAASNVIFITILADSQGDSLVIRVDDNGHGLQSANGDPNAWSKLPAGPLPPNAGPSHGGFCTQLATDPFYTTKAGKRTGLGLSLFRAAAQRAGGELVLGKSAMGGLYVQASMKLSHVDRCPLGDLAATVSSVACTDPQIDLHFDFRFDSQEYHLRVRDVATEVARQTVPPDVFRAAGEIAHRIKSATRMLT
jgi:hypothetical protein